MKRRGSWVVLNWVCTVSNCTKCNQPTNQSMWLGIYKKKKEKKLWLEQEPFCCGAIRGAGRLGPWRSAASPGPWTLMTWSLHYPFLARFSCTTRNKYSTGLYSIRTPLLSRVVRLTADCQQLSATAEDCTENSGQTRGAQGEPPSTADSEDVTHTHSGV